MDIEKLKRQLTIHEGYRSKVYKDSVGIATVGVGFNLERLDAVGCLQRVNANHKDVVTGKTQLSRDQIDALLECGARKVDAQAAKLVSNYDTLDDVRQRVVCDMIFNLGVGGFMGFHTTRYLIEQGDFEEAAKQMLKSKWAKQVGNRARILSRMMESGEDQYDL